jgi:hypothetical protein
MECEEWRPQSWAGSNRKQKYLHHLQILQSLLYQFLHLARVLDRHVLSEGISRAALRVLSEVVC